LRNRELIFRPLFRIAADQSSAECLTDLAMIYEKKWNTAAQLQAHLQQNTLSLNDDTEFKISFYVWLLGGMQLQNRFSALTQTWLSVPPQIRLSFFWLSY